jgi:hyaluronoglucosaminidase
VARTFLVRGVVEGFYGEPWSHVARLEMLEFLGSCGMNAYVYAPKDDPKHRSRWREPYDADEHARFRALVSTAESNGVRFGFAISPGLDITYDSDADRAVLADKLGGLVDVGVSWFLLLVDDIPMQAGLAPRQADLAHSTLERLRKDSPDATLTLCPTEYVGTRPSPYLTELARGLPPDVTVMWTGPTVCSPTIEAADARAWSDALLGRPPLLWDNYPVNDASMVNSLHLGPYCGRDPELADVVAGVLCNPMIQPRASKLALSTAAEFLTDPDEYDAERAWERAITAIGADRSGPLRTLARACRDSPLHRPDELDLARRLDTLATEIDGPGWPEAVADLAAELRAARSLPDAFAVGDTPRGRAHGDPLGTEVAPWAAAASAEAQTGLAALRVLQAIRPVATVGEDGCGRAVGPDAERAMHAVFLMLYSWMGARTNKQVVFGPRFAIYSAVIQLDDGRPGLDVGLSVREDANAIDRLCRLALDQYESWRTDPEARTALRVVVDGEERQVAPDGTFDAQGAMTIVRAGRYATRAGALPFREERL